MRGDLRDAVLALKQMPGDGVFVGGIALPMALAEMGLIDEYELVVHPRVVGHGPSLFAGLSRPLDLVLGERDFVIEFMAEGRLARIVPDPVLWASEANPDDVESTNVAFFLGSDQRLHIGAVLY